MIYDFPLTAEPCEHGQFRDLNKQLIKVCTNPVKALFFFFFFHINTTAEKEVWFIISYTDRQIRNKGMSAIFKTGNVKFTHLDIFYQLAL